MQIKILGFELNVNRGLPLSDFYNTLVGVSAQQQATLSRMLSEGVESVPAGSRPDKIICVDRHGALWRGMFIKLRSARSFMTVVREQSVLRLTAEQLQQNKAMVEVNFFVINEITGRGLYQHYHLSTHLDGFCNFCRLHYDATSVSRREALQRQLVDGAINKDSYRVALEDLRDTLTYAVMVRKENLQVLVSELEQIGSVELVLASKETNKEQYRPLMHDSMRQTVRYIFGRQNSTRRERIKKAVLEAVSSMSSEKKARIDGMLPGRISRVLELEQNYDVLGELDYDETAKDLKIDLGDLRKTLTQSSFIKRLMDLAERPDVKQRLEESRS